MKTSITTPCLLCLFALLPASSSRASDLAAVTESAARVDDDGLAIQLTVETDRDCDDVDVLVRVGPESAETGNALEDLYAGVKPFARVPWGPVSLAGGGSGGPQVALRATELSPVDPGKAILVTRRGGNAWIRYRLPGRLAAGIPMTASFTAPVPTDDEAPDVSAMVIGLSYPELRADDFDALPRFGVVGLTALLRTTGQEGPLETRKAQLAQLARQNELAQGLYEMVVAELSDAGQVHTFGVATAGWLMPVMIPSRYPDVAFTAITTSGTRTWTDRFSNAMADSKADDPLAWALALDHLVPRAGKGNLMVRLLALGVHSLDSTVREALLAKLATIPDSEQNRAAVEAFVDEAGPVLLDGSEGWSAETLRQSLARLGGWGVQTALQALFVDVGGKLRGEVLAQKIGRAGLLAAAVKMCREEVPPLLFQQLATGSKFAQALARDILVASGFPALRATVEIMIKTGYPPGEKTDEPSFAKDPEVLKRVVDRLHGILLTPRAEKFEAEAERLFLLEGDCLAPFEKATVEVHPQIVLPQPLYANCQAIRASMLSAQGRQDEAEKLIEVARKAGGDEPKVRSRHSAIMTTRARRLLDAKDLDGAEALCNQLDPTGRDPTLRSIRADVFVALGERAMEAGDKQSARAFFEQARKADGTVRSVARLMGEDKGRFRPIHLLILAMAVLGLLAAVLRFMKQQQALRSFYLLGDPRPVQADGPGRRRLLIGSQGLMAVRGWSHKLLPWAQVRSAFRTGQAGGPQGVIFWMEDGASFFLAASSYHRFARVMDAIAGSAGAAGGHFERQAPDDGFVEAENSDMAIRLVDAERQRSVMRGFGVALGAVVWLSLAFVDIGVGADMLTRMVAGLGMGGGFALIVLSLTDRYLPVASV